VATITSKAKGHRLQHLRNLAGLSRQEFCDQHGFNQRTLKSWELGDYKGIPESSAAKVLIAFLKEGVKCRLKWLMDGSGQLPILDQKKQILRALELFRKHNPKGIDLLINDDGMKPYFYPGDHVAGIKRIDHEIQNLIGLNCIIETVDNQILLRHLEMGTQKNHYNLTCLNPNTNIAPLQNIKVKSAAQVIWIRREEI
jgi:transcriptional regulator with XRE-family HTH domain